MNGRVSVTQDSPGSPQGHISFDVSVAGTTGPTFDDGFTINGAGPVTIDSISGNFVFFTSAGFIGTGDVWHLGGQPPWLNTAVIIPQDGNVIEN